MSWIEHVKRYQSENGCSYKDALKEAKSSYTPKTGGKLKIKKAFKKLGNTKEMHYGKNINNYIQKGNEMAQKYVKPVATAIPGVGQFAKLGFALADAQAGASQTIYNKTRKPKQSVSVEGGMIRPWEEGCNKCCDKRRRNPNEMNIMGSGSGLHSNKSIDNGSMIKPEGTQTLNSNMLFDKRSLTNLQPSITSSMYGGSFLSGGSFRSGK